MTTFRAICFDFDGTLAAFRGNFHDFLDSYRASLGLEQCDMNRYARLLSEELRQPGALSLASAVRSTLARLELRAPPDLSELIGAAVRDYAAQVRLLPGARELLEFAAARVPLALLTNGPEDMQRAAIRQAGVEKYFRSILISGDRDVAARKPDAHVFRLACVGLETPPEEMLMVGDSFEADVRGALGYGLQALHLGGEPGPGYDAVADLPALRAWLEPRLENRARLR